MGEVKIQQEVSLEEIERHLTLLNANWQRYGAIENHQVVFYEYFARADALDVASDIYSREEAWLEAHGYPWDCLLYDSATKTFSLP